MRKKPLAIWTRKVENFKPKTLLAGLIVGFENLKFTEC